jgi:adenine-specific DNA-methyltransferase
MRLIVLFLTKAITGANSVTKPGEEIAKFDLQSQDILDTRRQELLRLFPEVHTESGGINFDALRSSLGDFVHVGAEAFGMSWPGKAECSRVIQRQSIATLLPAVDESVNWNTTQNMIIEGDNLEVLKVLQKAYLGKVKMIYIDPPYNTGNDFIYPDNYTESLKTYLQYTGQVDDEGRKFSTNTESSGRFHSKWMNMMYPRLSLGRELLQGDGIMFISIDEHESFNLRIMCNEIFGPQNFIAAMSWKTRGTGGQIKKGSLIDQVETILVYAKDASNLGLSKLPNEREGETKWRDFRKAGGEWQRRFRPNQFFPLYFDVEKEILSLEPFTGAIEILPQDQNGEDGFWENGKATTSERLALGELRARNVRGRWKIEQFEVAGESSNAGTFIEIPSTQGADRIRSLFGEIVFPNSKPVGLIQHLILLGCGDGGLVLDFFGGSGTTADAVMSMQDKKERQWILVQLPEQLDEKNISDEVAITYCKRNELPLTITSILKARVNASIKKIAEIRNGSSENSQNDASRFGYRFLKLAPSNFAVWNANAIEGNEKNLEQQLFAQVENVLPGRTNQDILFELMLKSRYQLTTSVESVMVGQCEVWKVAAGEMVAIINTGLNVEVIREIASWKPISVVVLDRCFAGDDSLKANVRKIFEDAKVDLKTV